MSGATAWARWRDQAAVLGEGDGAVAAYDLGTAGGPAVTYLHGYPSASVDLAPVAERLAATHRLLAIDLPGFGASAKPSDHRYTIHAAADAVEALWAARGVERTLLAAHDYGVSVAQELLARRAEGRSAVALTGVVWMNGGLYPDLHRPTVGQQILLDPEQGPALAAAMTQALFTDGLRGTWGSLVPFDEPAVAAIWASMDERGGVRNMHQLLHYIADRREHEGRWRTALESCDLPMAFVWGDADPVSGAHMIARVEERVPDAQVVRFADAGHWPPLEVPDAVADAIRALT